MSDTEDSDFTDTTASGSSPKKEKDEKESPQPADENGFSERSKPKYPLFIKVNVNVDISYVMTSATHCNIMNVNVKEVQKNEKNESDTSEPKFEFTNLMTNLATAFKSINKRESLSSYSGSSSSGSSVGLPVSILTALLGAQTISEECIKSLKSKWDNTDLLLSILKYMDDNILVQDSKVECPKDIVSSAELKTSTPKKTLFKRRRPPTPDSEDEFQQGEKVFAQGADKKYYFATVESKCGYNMWRVMFCDGEHVKVRGENILKNSPELLFGHHVICAQKGANNVAYNALITGYSGSRYKVVSNCGDFDVSASNLIFTESQVKEIRKDGGLSESNEPDVSSKKFSSSQVSSIIYSQPKQHSSSRQGSPLKLCTYLSLPPIKPSCHKKFESSDDTSPKKSEDITEDVVIGCKREIKFNSRGYGIKLKSRKGKMPKPSVDDVIVGPVKNLTFFRGYNFILTCDDTFSKASSSDEASTDNESYEFSKVPYVYDRLALQITSAKGKIYERITDVPVSEHHKTYLIAPKPCLTEKYIECLTLNINIVCHEWIVNCVKQETVLPLQFLPVGWSIEKKKFINKFDRAKLKPLQNVTVAFWKKSNKRFIEFWSKICTMAGGTICYSERKKNCNYMLAEDSYLSESNSSQSSPPPKKTKTIPVVNTTWLIQCLINGKCLNPNLNPSAYLLTDSS